MAEPLEPPRIVAASRHFADKFALLFDFSILLSLLLVLSTCTRSAAEAGQKEACIESDVLIIKNTEQKRQIPKCQHLRLGGAGSTLLIDNGRSSYKVEDQAIQMNYGSLLAIAGSRSFKINTGFGTINVPPKTAVMIFNEPDMGLKIDNLCGKNLVFNFRYQYLANTSSIEPGYSFGVCANDNFRVPSDYEESEPFVAAPSISSVSRPEPTRGRLSPPAIGADFNYNHQQMLHDFCNCSREDPFQNKFSNLKIQIESHMPSPPEYLSGYY